MIGGQDRRGGVRLAIWLALCVAGASHGLVLWWFAPSAGALCLNQLGVSTVLALAGVAVLRLDAGPTLGGLALNLMLSVAAFLVGAAVVVAGFH